MATEHKGVYKQLDTMRGDRLKRNQNKYYRYHRDIGHTTEECIALKDEIEKLIQKGYLQNYVRNRGAKPREDQHEAKPPREIRTIFGGTHFVGKTQGAQNCCLKEAREGPVMTASSLKQRPTKQVRREAGNITFSEKDARHVHHPHCDALVIIAMVANNNVHRILVNNGSSIDILYF